MRKGFRKDFYWGGSVSSFQTEGAWNEGGKGLSIYDVRPTNPNFSDWKVAIDFYHRYKEDIALLKEMNFNFYRFSICWSRIIPNGDDEINEEGIDFYNRVIDELIASGITPMITLVHFDMPYHLVEKYNGFASREVVDLFERYARVCIERFGDRVKHWMSFNEQNLHANSLRFSNAEVIPEGKSYAQHLYQVNHNVMIAHCKAVKALRELQPDAKFCVMTTIDNFYPEKNTPKNNLFTKLAYQLSTFHNDIFTEGKYPDYVVSYLENRGWMPHFEPGDEELLRYTVDYLAFSYYHSNTLSEGEFDDTTPAGEVIAKHTVKTPGLEATEWGWEIDPDGIRWIVNDLYTRHKLPVFVLENGMGHRETLNEQQTVEDDYRIAFHRDHILALKKAVEEDGVDLLGYITWGPIDMPRAGCEIAKRYGFVYVNRDEHDIKDLKRTKKKSFYWVKEAFGSNGEKL